MRDVAFDICDLNEVGFDLSTIRPDWPRSLGSPRDALGPARRLADTISPSDVDRVRTAASFTRMGGLHGMVAGQQSSTQLRAPFLEPVMRLTMVAAADTYREFARRSSLVPEAQDPVDQAVYAELDRVYAAALSVGDRHLQSARARLRQRLDDAAVVRRFAVLEMAAPRRAGSGPRDRELAALWSAFVRYTPRGSLTSVGGVLHQQADPPGSPRSSRPVRAERLRLAAQEARAQGLDGHLDRDGLIARWNTALDERTERELQEPQHVLAVSEPARATSIAWTRQGHPQRAQELRMLALGYYPGRHEVTAALHLATVPAVVARVCAAQFRQRRLAYDLGPPGTYDLSDATLERAAWLRSRSGPMAHWDTVLGVMADISA